KDTLQNILEDIKHFKFIVNGSLSNAFSFDNDPFTMNLKCFISSIIFYIVSFLNLSHLKSSYISCLIKEKPRKIIKNTLTGIVIYSSIRRHTKSKHVWSSDVCSNDIKDTLQNILEDIKHFKFIVNGSLSIEKAFVTGGGISTKEIVPKTMGSK